VPQKHNQTIEVHANGECHSEADSELGKELIVFLFIAMVVFNKDSFEQGQSCGEKQKRQVLEIAEIGYKRNCSKVHFYN